MTTDDGNGYLGMVYFGDEQSSVTVQVHPTGCGTIEVVRTSPSGTTVHFDSPEDAVRRVNAWISCASLSPTEGARVLETMATLQLMPPIQGNIVRPADLTGVPAGYGRMMRTADTIEAGEREGDDRRSETRVRASDVDWLNGARSMYGADIRVIDISSSGILIETAHEMSRDATIALELFGQQGAIRVAGRVMRSRRFVQDDIVWYQTGCRFKRPVDLGGFVPQHLTTPDLPGGLIVEADRRSGRLRRATISRIER